MTGTEPNQLNNKKKIRKSRKKKEEGRMNF